MQKQHLHHQSQSHSLKALGFLFWAASEAVMFPGPVHAEAAPPPPEPESHPEGFGFLCLCTATQNQNKHYSSYCLQPQVNKVKGHTDLYS